MPVDEWLHGLLDRPFDLPSGGGDDEPEPGEEHERTERPGALIALDPARSDEELVAEIKAMAEGGEPVTKGIWTPSSKKTSRSRPAHPAQKELVRRLKRRRGRFYRRKG